MPFINFFKIPTILGQSRLFDQSSHGTFIYTTINFLGYWKIKMTEHFLD